MSIASTFSHRGGLLVGVPAEAWTVPPPCAITMSVQGCSGYSASTGHRLAATSVTCHISLKNLASISPSDVVKSPSVSRTQSVQSSDNSGVILSILKTNKHAASVKVLMINIHSTNTLIAKKSGVLHRPLSLFGAYHQRGKLLEGTAEYNPGGAALRHCL